MLALPFLTLKNRNGAESGKFENTLIKAMTSIYRKSKHIYS